MTMLQRYESAFAIESVRYHNLECDKAKKELSDELAQHDALHRLDRGICSFNTIVQKMVLR